MVNFEKHGPLMVNPYIDNRRRVVILGEALYGKHWRARLAEALGISHLGISMLIEGGGPDIDDQTVSAIIAQARRRIKDIEIAIESTKLPPFIG